MNDVGDVEGMAQNAWYILEDCDRLAKFKKAALKQAKNFDLALILPKYEDYYKEVIESSQNQLEKKLEL
jgi:glycosyltransferase involved in cell wall biosynthesis